MGTAAATARPVVNRLPELDAATPTVEATTNAVTAIRRVRMLLEATVEA
jgi:hypothetical protein